MITGSFRRQVRSFTAIACVLLLALPAVLDQDPAAIQGQIAAMPLGTGIEIRLKDGQKLRGARGAVSESGFALVDSRAQERQVAYGDVAAVRHFSAKSHTGRNILIGVAIGVAAVAIVIVALAKSGGYL